ncbi:hypothetical protein WJX72_007719 [[Myrmecia] bisecta]|uniref:TNase-like domain-containing protein n=1 Tax=[Myrmecia] bisecta TaxID=41462 RepID=A0AAW1PHW4_9CHLO
MDSARVKCSLICDDVGRVKGGRHWLAEHIVPLLSAAALFACGPSHASELIQGPARVVDGDTLEVAGQRVRLYGVDAPEKAQSCQDLQGHDFACGQVAGDALRQKVGQGSVRCEVKAKDMYGRNVSACRLPSNEDMGEWLVSRGYAVAYRQYSSDYIGAEQQAQAAHRGIWAGRFEIPADWRREHKRNGNTAAPVYAGQLALPPGRAQQQPLALLPAPSATPSRGAPQAASPAAQPTVTPAPPLAASPAPLAPPLAALTPPSARDQPPSPDCAIKGNISAKGLKIYHMPGGRFYNSTRIDAGSGERWFCSEKEAVAAGWRPAQG